MKGLHSYLELVENGRPLEKSPEQPALDEALLKLLMHARCQGELGVEGAWRLDSRVSRALEKEHGSSPPGGWAGLAGLACGCGVLKATREAFEPCMDIGEIADWTAESARRLLLEAFTRLLVPPSTAAGLFILLGLHPAWGLRVAHATHSRGRCEITGEAPGGIEPGWRDQTLFPDETSQIVEEATFAAISTILATLRKLSPGCRYPVDALASVVEQACLFARQSAEQCREEEIEPGLAPFLDNFGSPGGPRNHRALDFVTVDLLDSFLVPAGAARRFDDGTFCVFEGAFEGVRVGEMDAKAQEVKLTWLLAGECGCLVA
ncbi:MAG: hypothetical protein ACLFVJ_15185 [Persicimonas sp.]